MTETTGTTFDATKLRNALLNVEPHAEHNGTLPALGAVRLECDGTTLTLATTDRYILATETLETVEPGSEFAFLVDLHDVKRITDALKGAPRNVTYWPVTFTVEAATLTVTVPGLTITCPAVSGEFPRWRMIFEGGRAAATDDAHAVTHAAYNPQLLAKFAKVTVNGRKGNMLRMHFADPNKPAYVEIGGTFAAILMPVRHDWAASTVPASAARIAS